MPNAVKTNVSSNVVKSNQPVSIARKAEVYKALITNKSFTIARTNSPVVAVNTKMGGIMDITRIIKHEVPTPATDGSQKEFTLAHGYEDGLLDIYVDGLNQIPTTDYAETNPAAGIFTMVIAPASDEVLLASYTRRV